MAKPSRWSKTASTRSGLFTGSMRGRTCWNRAEKLTRWSPGSKRSRPNARSRNAKSSSTHSTKRYGWRITKRRRRSATRCATSELPADRMTLLERLAQELKAAMLARDAERLSTLRLLKSAVGYAQIERKTETLSDAEVAAIIQKELKKRRDAAEQFDQGGRPELANKE